MVCENIKQTIDELHQNPGLYLELQLSHDFSYEQQATRQEWKEIFRESGFRLIKERYLNFAKISIFIVY